MSMKESLFPLAFAGMGALVGTTLANCGPSQSLAKPEFAHRPSRSLIGTPLALAEYQQQGILTRQSVSADEPLEICTETNQGLVRADELLFETRLAYAAWWRASGLGAELFDSLSFKSRDNCPEDATRVAAVVLARDNGVSARSFEGRPAFEEPTYSCELQGSRISCGTSSITLGLGGPAAVRFAQFDGGSVAEVEIVKSAGAVMSPFVSWRPLRSVIAEHSGLTAAQRETLGKELEQLSGDPGAPMDALASFVVKLEENGMVGERDPVFGSQMDEFARSGRSSVRARGFRPSLPLFSTLLHEVGHQFGLDHADNPQADSVTGRAQGQKVGEGEQAKTDISVMSYALPYLFLTEDDKAGIRSVASSLPR